MKGEQGHYIPGPPALKGMIGDDGFMGLQGTDG